KEMSLQNDLETNENSVSPYLCAGFGIVFVVCLNALIWQFTVTKKIRDKKKAAINKLLQEFNKKDNPKHLNWRFATEPPNAGARYQNVLLIEIGEPIDLPIYVINISETPELENYLRSVNSNDNNNNSSITQQLHSSTFDYELPSYCDLIKDNASLIQ
ncbi:8752_t:CDS:2, partial [Ambispora leptoticha]